MLLGIRKSFPPQILSNLGNWFGLVATLLVVESLAEGQGLLLSVVVIMRFLPAFILFPVAGVCADRQAIPQ